MMRSLGLKLILAFLFVGLAGAALMAVFAGQATASEFGEFMFDQNREFVAAQLAGFYQTYGSWVGVENTNLLDGSTMGGMMGQGQGWGRMMHGAGGPGGSMALADASGRVVVSGAGHRLGDRLSPDELAQGTPIIVEGRTAGTLIERRDAINAMMTSAGTAFLDRINRLLLGAAIGATALAVLLGVFLARTLTRPLRELTTATRAVAAGHLEQRVSVQSQDELGDLAASFNQMSADLTRARDQRRQMTADIAHDLRTPLSVILGHAEALRDGVIAPTPEELDLIHDEAKRLNRLVDDLRTLSLAETGELQLTRRDVSPQQLVERMAAAYTPRAHQKGIKLHSDIAPNLPDIDIDPDRIQQVLGNLLDNALRHTPAGGAVTLSAANQPAAHTVTLSVRDTGPGIAPEDLPRIFDRFYRADKSRQRDQGGSGLGLAIAKSIVESHGGRIRVESRLGEGTQFHIDLPARTS
jgi:signal transduction histidine kinase